MAIFKERTKLKIIIVVIDVGTTIITDIFISRNIFIINMIIVIANGKQETIQRFITGLGLNNSVKSQLGKWMLPIF